MAGPQRQLSCPMSLTPSLDAEAPGRMAAPILVVQFFPDGSFDFQDELDGDWKPHGSTVESRAFLASNAVGAVQDQNQSFQMPALTQARQVSLQARQTSPAGAKPAGPSYFQKMQGNGSAPGTPPITVVLWAMAGAFLGILVLTLLHFKVCVAYTNTLQMYVGSFGAQAVLLFAANQSPLTQPWNAMFGSVVAAALGVSSWQIFGVWLFPASQFGILGQLLAPPFGVSACVGAMMLTRSVHPPAGALALIATLQPDKFKDAGFIYVLFPALFGSLVHMIIALLFNNLSSQPCRFYPATWRFYKAPERPKMDPARQVSADSRAGTAAAPAAGTAAELAKVPLRGN